MWGKLRYGRPGALQGVSVGVSAKLLGRSKVWHWFYLVLNRALEPEKETLCVNLIYWINRNDLLRPVART